MKNGLLKGSSSLSGSTFYRTIQNVIFSFYFIFRSSHPLAWWSI